MRDVEHTPDLGLGQAIVPAQRRRQGGAIVRRQGGAIVDKFDSTDKIKNPEVSLARKKLALFLMVSLVDDHGQMSTAYDNVIREFENTPNHWSLGKDRATLQKACGRFLGCGTEASIKLHWSKVRDLLTASGRDDVMPEAADLFCQVVGLAEPEEGYLEERRRPVWDKDGITVFTSYMVGGREWALRFWDEAKVDTMAPTATDTAAANTDHDSAQVTALLTRLEKSEKSNVTLRGEIHDLRATLQASWLQLNEAVNTVSTWQERAELAERELGARTASLEAREEALREAEDAVEEQRRGLDEVVRTAEKTAAELVQQAKQRYGQESWKLRRELVDLQKQLHLLEDENLARRAQVMALRNDVLDSLKRRNPAASPATLRALLEDILPAGVKVELTEKEIAQRANQVELDEDSVRQGDEVNEPNEPN